MEAVPHVPFLDVPGRRPDRRDARAAPAPQRADGRVAGAGRVDAPGADAAEDAALGAALRDSAKDTHEHALRRVADRGAARPVGRVGPRRRPLTATLRVDPEPTLLRLDNVQHLATRVEGELALVDGPPTALRRSGAVAGAGLDAPGAPAEDAPWAPPCATPPHAAVGAGHPRDLAWTWPRIREREGMDRPGPLHRRGLRRGPVRRARGHGPRPLPARRLVHRGASLPELAWMEAVDAVAAEVRAGTGLRKAVLARDVLVDAPERLDPRLLAARLAERFPHCWTFLVDGLIGATPELLLRRSGRTVASLVLAGSTRRGADAAEDAALAAALRDSAKDTHEHALSVASVRDVLAPLTATLRVDPEPTLLRLDNVQHLATRVEGELAGPATALDLVAALHPTAAVCGTPRDLALARIREREGMDRGRYSGPVGWVDATGDGEFGIALRCAELTPTGARLFAGAGVVGSSLPEAELDETRLKLRAMQSALES